MAIFFKFSLFFDLCKSKTVQISKNALILTLILEYSIRDAILTLIFEDALRCRCFYILSFQTYLRLRLCLGKLLQSFLTIPNGLENGLTL